MKKDCTMVVSTCDKYDDTWEAFFKCVKKNWPKFDMPIILNTESKEYKLDGLDIRSYKMFKNQNVPWGKRLKEHLKKVDTEFVFFMLDDYFLVEKVDTKMIEQCIKWMKKDDNIAVFSFHRVDDPNNIPSEKYKNFDLRPLKGDYRLNCQAAVWRKDILIECIKDEYSPWDFEIYGSVRSRKFKNEFYAIREGIKEPLNYCMHHLGTGICRGKWVKSVVVPLFKELGIKMDFSKRGFVDETDDGIVTRRTFWQKVKGKLKYYKALLESKF